MAKEDTVLPLEMQKLEIEPAKFNASISEKNPFQHKYSAIKRTHIYSSRLLCPTTTKCNKSHTLSKKSHKILKEPKLKLLSNNQKESSRLKHHMFQRSLKITSDNFSVCALVDNCNQLKISSEQNEDKKVVTVSKECTWWKSEPLPENQIKGSDNNRSGPSCSQQALNPPCDVTIDELASYFETLVHIPKKMSSMAEMMYI